MCGRERQWSKNRYALIFIAAAILFASHLQAQTSSGSQAETSGGLNSRTWSTSVTADGYVVPHAEFYVSPTVTADWDWLHAEARYNYEDRQTGSLWFGYNFSVGHRLVFEATPMIGGVFGNTTGIAPGYEVALTYKRVSLTSSGEYVFDRKNRNGSFFYSWPQLTYSPVDWLHVGLVAQRTKAYHTNLDVQRGVLAGISYRKVHFTTYIFNAGWTKPTLVVELNYKF